MKILLFPLKLILAILLFILGLALQIIGAFISFIGTVFGVIGTILGIICIASSVIMTVMMLFVPEIQFINVAAAWIFSFLWCSTLFWGIKVGEWISRQGRNLGDAAKSLITKQENIKD